MRGGLYVLVAILKKTEYNLNDNVGMSYINTSFKLHRKKYQFTPYIKEMI